MKKTFFILIMTLFIINCSDTNEYGSINLRVEDSSLSNLGKVFAPNLTEFSEIKISVIRIELMEEDSGAVVEDYSNDPLLIDLIDIGSTGSLIITDAEIPVGDYNKIRFIIEAPEENDQAPTNPNSYIVLNADFSTHPLFVPSGAQSGLKVDLDSEIDLREGSSFEIIFDFNSEQSIIKTGQNDRYILKPTSMSATVLDNT